MNKAEAGKLGYIKSKLTHDAIMQEKLDQYNINPAKCTTCGESLDYKIRKNKFCSRSCSVKHNNTKRTKSKFTKFCVTCNSPVKSTSVYCSIRCQKEKQYRNTVDSWKTNGSEIGKQTLRRYLTETYGYKCSVCNISAWNNKPIVLEVEHKDGNSYNNSEDNLCFICPNCHSQTDTYKGKNVGKGRHYRRERYKQGKSY